MEMEPVSVPVEIEVVPLRRLGWLLVALNIGFLLGLAVGVAIISNICWLLPK